jgi:hypothetical protein
MNDNQGFCLDSSFLSNPPVLSNPHQLQKYNSLINFFSPREMASAYSNFQVPHQRSRTSRTDLNQNIDLPLSNYAIKTSHLPLLIILFHDNLRESELHSTNKGWYFLEGRYRAPTPNASLVAIQARLHLVEM